MVSGGKINSVVAVVVAKSKYIIVNKTEQNVGAKTIHHFESVRYKKTVPYI